MTHGTYRYTVTLQHREEHDFQTWSVLANEPADAVALAQRQAGGGAWEPVSIAVEPTRRAA